MAVGRVLFAAACLLAMLGASVVDATATLSWGDTPMPGEPSTIKVVINSLLVNVGDYSRVEIHLPGFGGAYNSFGALHSATVPSGVFLPTSNGITVLDANGDDVATANVVRGAEWDASREILKFTLGANAANFRGAKIDSKFLKMFYQSTGKASQLGPLPPLGGINSDWYKLAYVRHFPASGGNDPTLCTGSEINVAASQNVGIGKEQCKFTDFLTTPGVTLFEQLAFTSTSATLASSQPRIPVHKTVPAAGYTMAPYFSTLKAAGTNTGAGSDNCITVTLASSVPMVSADQNSATGITLHGLTGASTLSTETLPLYLDGTCGAVPAADSTRGVRIAGGQTVTDGTPTTADRLVSAAATKRTWQAVWSKEDGTLKLQVGEGFSISASELIVFSFKLSNGPTPQASRAITASASGFYCKTNLCMNSDDVSLVIPGTAFQSSSKILHIKVPTFETAKVSQSTTDPGQVATVTVELKANQALKTDGSIITITGICGTLTNDDVTLTGVSGVTVSDAGTLKATASWTVATKTLKITTGTAGLVAGTTYQFSFSWLLVDIANTACPIMIAATGTNTFAQATMTNVDGKTGNVEAPAFTKLQIGQYSTRPDTDNYVCVTLKTNYDFKSASTNEGANDKSTFTIAGLLGSQKQNEQNTQLYDCPTATLPTPGVKSVNVPFKPLTAGRTVNTYDFLKATGSAVFVMDDTGFTRGTTYIFAMRIKNSKAANPCQTVTLTATGDIVQSSTMSPDKPKAKAIQDGENEGDVCPLRTYAPGFLVKKIGQDSKLAGEDNVLTVTLRSNVDFTSAASGLYAVVTISGLTGSSTPDTTTVADLTDSKFVVANQFTPDFSSVAWNRASGTLLLTIEAGTVCAAPTLLGDVSDGAGTDNTCMKAGSQYVFSVKLGNGATAQAAPIVRISVLYGTSEQKNTAVQVMDAPANMKLAALYILPADQILDTYNIGQLEAAQGARNGICVTLTPNKNLASLSDGGGVRFVAFTIRGLTGFATDTQELNLFKLDGTTALADLPATDFFCPTEACTGTTDNKANFNAVTSELSFFLKVGNTMLKDTEYAFCFQVSNPKNAMSCKSAVIAAKDIDTAAVDAVVFTMTQDTGMLSTFPPGSKCAGYTAPRSFSTATLRVDSSVSGFESTCIIELVTNYKIGAQKTITFTGLTGFRALGQGTAGEAADVDFLTVTENGVHAVDLGNKGSWDGTSVLTFTTGSTADATELKTWGALDSTVTTKRYMYEISFKLRNPAVAQAGPAVSVSVSDGFSPQAVDTGLAYYSSMRRRTARAAAEPRRALVGAISFTYTALSALYGGESLVIDLPHYTGEDGAIFGVSSSPSDAFSTYATSAEWVANGVSEKKGRATFTNGFVAKGNDKSGTAGVNGVLILDSDDTGYDQNKESWFSEGSIWQGKVVDDTTNNLDPVYDGIQNVYKLVGSTALMVGSTNRALSGTILSCKSGDVTQSRFVLTTANSTDTSAVVQVLVDQAFDLTPDGTSPNFFSTCTLAYKHQVGKYTGHKVMLENGKEYTMKQGAGPFYQVSEGTGEDISSTLLDNKKYTVYSQLVLTARQDATVAEGEEITITLPAGAVLGPSDTSALVNEEDEDEASIKDKTTIRHMLVAPTVYAPAAGTDKSKFSLSKTWPYASASESADHLIGKYVELYGAGSLLAAGSVGSALDSGRYVLTTTLSSLSTDDLKSHDTSATAWLHDGHGGTALVGGLKDLTTGGASGASHFWTALGDVTPTSTGALITFDATKTTLNRTLTEPLHPPGFNGSKAATTFLTQDAWLFDSVGQFVGNDPNTNFSAASTLTDIVGLGTFVPQEITAFTAGDGTKTLAVLTTSDTSTNTDRQKHFSSSIRAAITLVPAATFMFGPAFGDCSAGPTLLTVAAGIKTCGSDIGSVSTSYPCGVKFAISGAGDGAPAITLGGDIPATACFTVRVLGLDDVTFPADESLTVNADTATLKKFKWGRKWLVVTSILDLVLTGFDGAVTISSGVIAAVAGPPSRRRLLATCPTGYEYRMGPIGSTFADTCGCPSACDAATAACNVTGSGNWTAVLVPVAVCAADVTDDNTGAVVGGIVGGVLGLLLLVAIGYYCCRRQEQGPVGRATPPDKNMVPVYLPQNYPVIPAEYAPANAPMPGDPSIEYQQNVEYLGAQPMQPVLVEEQPTYIVQQGQYVQVAPTGQAMPSYPYNM